MGRKDDDLFDGACGSEYTHNQSVLESGRLRLGLLKSKESPEGEISISIHALFITSSHADRPC